MINIYKYSTSKTFETFQHLNVFKCSTFVNIKHVQHQIILPRLNHTHKSKIVECTSMSIYNLSNKYHFLFQLCTLNYVHLQFVNFIFLRFLPPLKKGLHGCLTCSSLSNFYANNNWIDFQGQQCTNDEDCSSTQECYNGMYCKNREKVIYHLSSKERPTSSARKVIHTDYQPVSQYVHIMNI